MNTFEFRAFRVALLSALTLALAPAVQAGDDPIQVAAVRSAAPMETRPSAAQAYTDALRAGLQGIAHYPTSREARQVWPMGTVQLWFELDRQGRLLASGIAKSSGVRLLDDAALKTLRTARFPAFPGEAFAGQDARRFTLPVEFGGRSAE